MAADTPNIVIFMPDEMRADSLGCYGNAAARTPNFDRLAREGARFSNCHVQFPVCGASRCSMMTGWPASVRGHRSLSYFLRPEEPNLFRYLKRAGYDVFWFGKNDLLAAQSFPDSVTRWTERNASYSGSTRPQPLDGAASTFRFGPMGDRRDTWDHGMVRLAIETLERTQQDAPFCIFIPISQPHPPYTAPLDFYDLCSPDDVGLVPPGLPGKPRFHRALRETYGLDGVSEAIFRKIRAIYYGQVAYTDWLLGELMEALQRTGRDRDTALIVLSDHGDYAGDYGLVEKWPSGLEDALTRVPLLARIPGGKTGQVVDTMVEAYDLMATCLDLAGVQARHTHFARSLVPQLDGAGGDPDRAAFAEAGYNIYEPQCFEPLAPDSALYGRKASLQNEQPELISRAAMIRTQTAKLILRPQGESELYDLAADPSEQHNLYGEQGAVSMQQALQLRLLEWFVNTTGIAPRDRDQRASPQFFSTVSFPGTDLAAILDR